MSARSLVVGCVVALWSVTTTALPRDYPIRAVPMTAVTIDDGFWAPKLETNRKVTIPHILEENEDTGRVANFEKAAGKKSGPYEGRRFNALEAINNGGRALDLAIPRDAALPSRFRADLPSGVEVITGTGNRPFVAIPYYAWNNRSQGEMAVWIKEK